MNSHILPTIVFTLKCSYDKKNLMLKKIKDEKDKIGCCL